MSAAREMNGAATRSATTGGLPRAGDVPLDPRDRGGPAQPLLTVEGLRKHFPVRGGLLNRQVATVQAVDDVSFSVRKCPSGDFASYLSRLRVAGCAA